MKLSENFSLNEFKSKCGADFPLEVIENLKKLSGALQVIRNEVKEPISITSGYRSPEHNKKVGGAKNSTHLTGMGVDFKVSNMTPSQVFTIVDRLINEGKIPQGGLKAYASWVHYDIRGIKARW